MTTTKKNYSETLNMLLADNILHDITFIGGSTEKVRLYMVTIHYNDSPSENMFFDSDGNRLSHQQVF